MQYLWSLDVDTLEEFFELVKILEKDLEKTLTMDEREIVFLELMKQRNKKPFSGTEFTKEELWSQLVKDGKTILNIDKDGYKIIKKKEEEL
jgi:hypothetical protein